MNKKIYSGIRLVIADDHEIFREGFNSMLKKQKEIELVGEAENGAELIELAGSLQPDVIVTDIKMPVTDGIEATKVIKEKYPSIHIIALTMFDDEDLIIEMLEAGADGYLIKNAHKTEIIEAVKTVYKGQPYYCNHTSNKLAQLIARSKFNPSDKTTKPDLTSKETEIMRLICSGLSNKEMAAQLNLSVRTIESHRENIYEKTGTHNTAGIVVYSIRNEIYKI